MTRKTDFFFQIEYSEQYKINQSTATIILTTATIILTKSVLTNNVSLYASMIHA